MIKVENMIDKLKFFANIWNCHIDDVAANFFALAMQSKLADARRYHGRRGWHNPYECTKEDLSRMLREHVEKGDPVDVANFCMMLYMRGESIAPKEKSAQFLPAEDGEFNGNSHEPCTPNNFRFYYFKKSGKYYSEGEGHISEKTFDRWHFDESTDRYGNFLRVILSENNGRLPGLSSSCTDLSVTIVPKGDSKVGWPIIVPAGAFSGE